jgi:hypothetical protein
VSDTKCTWAPIPSRRSTALSSLTPAPTWSSPTRRPSRPSESRAHVGREGRGCAQGKRLPDEPRAHPAMYAEVVPTAIATGEARGQLARPLTSASALSHGDVLSWQEAPRRSLLVPEECRRTMLENAKGFHRDTKQTEVWT